jgi:hypothetical protein
LTVFWKNIKILWVKYSDEKQAGFYRIQGCRTLGSDTALVYTFVECAILPLPDKRVTKKGCFMKNTIKWFGIIAFVAVIGFSVAACGDVDDGGDEDHDGKLIGTWVNDDAADSPFGYKYTLKFESNGKLTLSLTSSWGSGDRKEFSWSTSDGILTLISSGALYDVTYTVEYSISGKSLTVSKSDIPQLRKGTYTKQ